ncbi:MAG: MotA/TolQ/ExbB proton channel family protein [Desulfovibrionaceae bacterium]|jgi:biopolymer transport protein ExbB|nr:MotA/TolQ/ExbB proton channel family protein [Desulfovibrionaceae bacterium]
MPHDLLAAALEHLRGGGWVMAPLAVVSVALWYLVLRAALRCVALNRSARPLAECLGGCCGAPWQAAILAGFRSGRTGDAELDRRLLDALVARELESEERRTATILVLAGLAPLLGLLGTVGGMIATFDTILQFGTGNARGLAAGISSALITTQTGLIVAVPGLVAGCVLRRRVARLRERALRFGLVLQGVLDGRAAAEAAEAKDRSEREVRDAEEAVPDAAMTPCGPSAAGGLAAGRPFTGEALS